MTYLALAVFAAIAYIAFRNGDGFGFVAGALAAVGVLTVAEVGQWVREERW